jgi:hypothetical protein
MSGYLIVSFRETVITRGVESKPNETVFLKTQGKQIFYSPSSNVGCVKITIRHTSQLVDSRNRTSNGFNDETSPRMNNQMRIYGTQAVILAKTGGTASYP